MPDLKPAIGSTVLIEQDQQALTVQSYDAVVTFGDQRRYTVQVCDEATPFGPSFHLSPVEALALADALIRAAQDVLNLQAAEAARLSS